MKNIKFFILLAVCAFAFSSCKNTKYVYIQSTTMITAKGDTIITYGGRICVYPDGDIFLNIGDKEEIKTQIK